jgi:tripeptide aminopeptidase
MTSAPAQPTTGLGERLSDLFCTLTAIPSPSGEEAACAAVVEETLNSLGLDVARDDVTARIGGDCDNLYCAIPATNEGQPLFFCAHLDTVPPTEPLRPVLKDGALRNATPGIIGADNKAAVVVLLELARTLQHGAVGHGGVELLFSVGEEQGLRGSSAFATSRINASAGFVFDHPGKIGSYVTAAPSRFSLTATTIGRASHASIAPEDGVNAIAPLARGIAKLPAWSPGVGVNIAQIEGGRSWNVVPDRATLRVDIRSIDDRHARETVATLTEILRKVAEEAGCKLEIQVENPYVGYRLPENSHARRLVNETCTELQLTPELIETRGGSDANAFRLAGLDCVNLAHGVVDFHGPNEHVTVDDLVLMHDFAITLLAIAHRATSSSPVHGAAA